jgi:hypothetical protein
LKTFILILAIISGTLISTFGQYAPAAGETGSTALYKDDPSFLGWASYCNVRRGFINISDTTISFTQDQTTSNRAFFGSENLALGPPKGALDCISLGDGGSVILTFDFPVRNGQGPDFAVFENGLKMQEAPFQYFLELAFVEVSTDGKKFVRFPAVSNTPLDSQMGTFGQIDPTQINNLAGKYVCNYGTPFDLEELKDSAGINTDSINFIKIVDVIGDIDPKYASHDSKGQIINDPFPTEFWSGGFDLDAVGVIHFNNLTAVKHVTGQTGISIYPNPVKSGQLFNINFSREADLSKSIKLDLWSADGRIVNSWNHYQGEPMSFLTPALPHGIYFLSIKLNSNTTLLKMIVE